MSYVYKAWRQSVGLNRKICVGVEKFEVHSIQQRDGRTCDTSIMTSMLVIGLAGPKQNLGFDLGNLLALRLLTS